MTYQRATITSIDERLMLWYASMLFESVEVTSQPIYPEYDLKRPSQGDIFVLKASYEENKDKRNGEKVYKGIRRSHLQFDADVNCVFKF